MDVRLNHNPRNPITAKVHESVGSYLTLDFEQPNGNNISLFLPAHMAAATHLIADLFNSHIGRNQMAAMAVQSISEGMAVVQIPDGAVMPSEGAIAIISAIIATEEPIKYVLGDVNSLGQILVQVSDETTAWLDRGRAWVTAAQAKAAEAYGWETFMVIPDCSTANRSGDIVAISRR